MNRFFMTAFIAIAIILAPWLSLRAEGAYGVRLSDRGIWGQAFRYADKVI